MITGTIIQYRPAYFSGFENLVQSFSCLKDLLNIAWVDSFRKLPNGQNKPNFHRFSISKYSDHPGYEYTLMAEYDDGKTWWVIGYLDENEIIKELPIWEVPK